MIQPLKNEILPFVTTCMDLEGLNRSEISQAKERQIPYDLSCMWTLKKNKNTQTKKLHRNREQIGGLVVARGRAWGVEEMGEGGISLYSK